MPILARRNKLRPDAFKAEPESVFAQLARFGLSIATKNQPFSQGGWGGCDSLIAT
jgi:hypothetical protein